MSAINYLISSDGDQIENGISNGKMELKFIYLQEAVKQEVLLKMISKIKMELCQDLQDY